MLPAGPVPAPRAIDGGPVVRIVDIIRIAPEPQIVVPCGEGVNDRGGVPDTDLDLQAQVAPHLRRPQLRRVRKHGSSDSVEDALPQRRGRVITGGFQEGFGVYNIWGFGYSVARQREEFLSCAAIPRPDRE